jgi:hypothetical protein
MVANGKLPDSYESLVAAFDLEDELIAEGGFLYKPHADLEDEIDLLMALPADEI